MANTDVPDDLKYADTHEWVRVQGDEATIGISEYAQDELGDVVYLDLPWDDAGQRELRIGDHFGDIESVKATSELFIPISGTLLRVNDALKAAPEQVNSDPYGAGWMLVVKLSDPAELAKLMDAAAYAKFLESEGH
ncbi:MAG: Glycine cleavage system H protein [Ktedonobacterales bacterium]|jgi:glycine cleavage system H protein|nr:MAG: Glycine cleavage system H protein [Ktedonobacterales bacterium]